MNNQGVVQQIQEYSTGILSKMQDRTFTEFQLRELDFGESGLSLRGIPLGDAASAKVLGTLRVKKNFTEIGQKMSPEDWSTVSFKLKNAEGDSRMFGSLVGNEDVKVISDIYDQNESKKISDDQINYESYFRWLCSSLSETDKNYGLKSIDYNEKKDKFSITLIENDNEVDVFGTKMDLWKPGQHFTFSGLYFNYAPFLERLVCSNGNIARQYGFGTDISKKRYNNQKIENTIRQSILERDTNIPSILSESTIYLQQNEISLAEFYQYMRFFASRNENNKYDRIIEKYFNETPFYQAYGIDIKEKSNKWKTTARTGINAYDFFNLLTWIASHPEEVKMDREDQLQLQIAASNLLFKENLDLEDVAPAGVKVNYGRLVEMN
jgi:hypothetical protein